jgi:RNA polymerase sigma-70 factor (ECF subfamily)
MVGAASASASTSTLEGKGLPLVEAPSFEAVYERYFPYIWRSVQRLGVPTAHTDDVVQEVFIIAHQKMAAFQGRSSIKTWLYGIALRRARVHRARAPLAWQEECLDDAGVRAPDAARPDSCAEYAEAARVVNTILNGLAHDQREVFVLAELEELSATEIAEVLGVKPNTVYSRLRLAREAFDKAVARYRAREGRGRGG